MGGAAVMQHTQAPHAGTKHTAAGARVWPGAGVGATSKLRRAHGRGCKEGREGKVGSRSALAGALRARPSRVSSRRARAPTSPTSPAEASPWNSSLGGFGDPHDEATCPACARACLDGGEDGEGSRHARRAPFAVHLAAVDSRHLSPTLENAKQIAWVGVTLRVGGPEPRLKFFYAHVRSIS